MSDLERPGREPGIDEETSRPNERNDPSRIEPSEVKMPDAAEQEYPVEGIPPSRGEKRGGSKPSGEDVDSGNE